MKKRDFIKTITNSKEVIQMRHYTKLVAVLIIICFFGLPLSVAHSRNQLGPVGDFSNCYPSDDWDWIRRDDVILESRPCEKLYGVMCWMCCYNNILPHLQNQCIQYEGNCLDLCIEEVIEEYNDCRQMCRDNDM